MADTLDVLSLANAKVAISMDAATVAHDVVLARHVTAISRIIDDACGPVVVRTVTAEVLDGGACTVLLRRRPVTSVSLVREVTSPGTIATRSAAAWGSATDGYYLPPWERDPTLKSGVVKRMGYGSPIPWTCGEDTVEVTYVAGRYATTAAVDARFADAAGAVLRRLWKREAGSWAQSAALFEDADPQAGSGFFRVARPIIEEMLADEVQHRPLGFA